MTPSGVYGPNLTTERRLTWPAAVLVAAAALAAAPAAVGRGQFSSSVNLVEVYVSVTDRQGQPVKGLSREDFTVREDGKVQQVTTFAAGDFPLSVAVALEAGVPGPVNLAHAANSKQGDDLVRAQALAWLQIHGPWS